MNKKFKKLICYFTPIKSWRKKIRENYRNEDIFENQLKNKGKLNKYNLDYLNNDLISRFFVKHDKKTFNFIYDLPKTWWSRFYEYEWVKNFINKNDIVLDAASGIFHPLKYYLANNCRDVYSCDINKNIIKSFNDIEDLSSATDYDLTQKQIDILKSNKNLNKIHNQCCSITDLPYEDKKFDKIFCISVLEHLNDKFNAKYEKLFPYFKNILKEKDLYYSLKEFSRVLKNDGLIILTFDYPNINLKYFKKLVKNLNLEFVSDVNFNILDDVLTDYNLCCFRVLLRKKERKNA